MAYHESFWVVIGTAAPVIALAAVVTYNQATDLWGRTRPLRKLSVGYWWGWFAAIVTSSALSTEIVALFMALESLRYGDNFISPRYAINMTLAGLVLLLVAGVVVLNPRGLEHRRPAARRRYPSVGRQPSWRAKRRAR